MQSPKKVPQNKKKTIKVYWTKKRKLKLLPYYLYLPQDSCPWSALNKSNISGRKYPIKKKISLKPNNNQLKKK
jgi:hypothetical protein